MPCDSIAVTSVMLDKNTNPELLFEALKTMGLNPVRKGNLILFGYGETYNIKTGEMRATQGRDIAEIKKAMSGENIKTNAKKFGWLLKPHKTKKYTYVVIPK